MFSKNNETLLKQHLKTLPATVCKRSLRLDMDDLVTGVFARAKLAVIDDKNTSFALGDALRRALKGRFAVQHIMLEGMPVADLEIVEYVRKNTASCDVLIAVGSGTINDICKYASFLDGKPYIVFPTAASMNGYLSANASITFDGYKKTVTAHMPHAVFCDISIIADAPVRLHKGGLGDALARSTAQADWLLSHLLLDTPYNEVPFDLLKPIEPELLDNARGIAMSDHASIELLIQNLLLSGLGMTIAGGSYPASQAEHMIAHAYGMLLETTTLHGEEIAVTTLAMSHMQEKLLRARPSFRPFDFPTDAITKYFGKNSCEEAQKAYKIKTNTICHPERSEGSLQRSFAYAQDDKIADWETIAAKIEEIRISPPQIQSILQAAQIRDTPEAIGWNTASYQIALTHARFLRDRFTFLDLQ